MANGFTIGTGDSDRLFSNLGKSSHNAGKQLAGIVKIILQGH